MEGFKTQVWCGAGCSYENQPTNIECSHRNKFNQNIISDTKMAVSHTHYDESNSFKGEEEGETHKNGRIRVVFLKVRNTHKVDFRLWNRQRETWTTQRPEC